MLRNACKRCSGSAATQLSTVAAPHSSTTSPKRLLCSDTYAAPPKADWPGSESNPAPGRMWPAAPATFMWITRCQELLAAITPWFHFSRYVHVCHTHFCVLICVTSGVWLHAPPKLSVEVLPHCSTVLPAALHRLLWPPQQLTAASAALLQNKQPR